MVLLILVVLLGVGAFYLVNGSGSSQARSVASTVSPSPTPSVSPTPRPSSAVPEVTQSPAVLASGDGAAGGSSSSAAAPTTSAAQQTGRPSVVVLNQTSTSGLAGRYAARVTAAGWTVDHTGNFTGRVPATTVYYPAGYSGAAQELAAQIGIGRIRPAFSGISTSSLTVIIADGSSSGSGSGGGTTSSGTSSSSSRPTATSSPSATTSPSSSPVATLPSPSITPVTASN